MEDKSAKILLDVPVEDGVLGFDNYRDALNSIIKSSDPHFTIGIFGGWGTGKTTLMKMMRKQLDEEGEITVWFNPWQYEKEEHLMLPLLQTIELELRNRKVARSATIRKLGKTIVALMSSFSAQIPLVGVDLSAKDAIDTYENLFESRNLSSIYFELQQQLSTVIMELREKNKDRIVVFIDDVDRCLPDKALQVLESIKAFLDVPGYIFVLGLSRNIIERCVDAKYQEKSGVTGSQYLRKMIQVPFTLPGLREREVAEYLKALKKEIEGSEAERHVADYLDIILEGLEPNPREIKRFINNFILVSRISRKETDPGKLLAVLVTQFRWEDFYRDLAKHKTTFLDQTAAMVRRRDELKEEIFRRKAEESWIYFDLISSHLRDEQFFNFLQGAGKVLFEIQDLDPYIHFPRSVVLGEESAKREASRPEPLELSWEKKIREPHKITSHRIRGLRRAHLKGANLRAVNLTNVDLSWANLSRAHLRGANLQGAQLQEALLLDAYLNDATLVGANLSGANLTGAFLSRADLRGIVVDARTIFDNTDVTAAQNLSSEIRNQLHIDAKNGVVKATNKSLLEKRKSGDEPVERR